MWGPSMLEKKNPLPGPQLGPASDDRDRLAVAGQDRPNVRWHVIGPLTGVDEIGGILRHEMLEKSVEILAGGGVGIFHDDEAAARVPRKNRDCAVRDPAFRDRFLDFAGDLVSSLSVGP